MSQINVSNLTFSYEGSADNIFSHVSFSIDTDWKLGLIGRNGKGKTTFLQLLMGNCQYSGKIQTSTVFDYFPYSITTQQMALPAADFLDKLKSECELWRVICELEQLHETAELLYRPFHTLSPGERTKILLSVLFSADHHFLLIDEPTNHLDQESREQTAAYLSSKKGFILVSHDRDLLDTCIDHVLVLNRQTIEVQKGNFSSWWENKQRKDQFAQAENEKHLAEIRKLKQAVTRTNTWAAQNERTKIGFDPIKEPDRPTRAYIGAKTKKMQRRSKQLQNRIQQQLEAKEGLLMDLEYVPDLKINPLIHPKKTLVHLKDYTVQYANTKNPVFTGLTFSICQGDRIALHGKNGCGKSTLLNILLQKAGYANTLPVPEDPDTGIDAHGGLIMNHREAKIYETGICETASGLSISYISQHTSMLTGSLAQFCEKLALSESLLCAVLRQLALEREQFQKDLKEYSQGQKKKVLLAASLLIPAHLYIWDEPLNYMDVFSRMQIEKLLLDFQPTMLFVEHDARFREKIATKMIAMETT